jgi:hypothetical protein
MNQEGIGAENAVSMVTIMRRRIKRMMRKENESTCKL